MEQRFSKSLLNRVGDFESLMAELVAAEKLVSTEHGTAVDLGYCKLAKRERIMSGKVEFTVINRDGDAVLKAQPLLMAAEYILRVYW